ncbi:hypothetical protein Q3G72_010184 [Acer saccharum]|nr:hypothetical protein Q3G72_010184 [Acer saccharum]
MLKLRKILSHKSGDRLDFKFSDFKALEDSSRSTILGDAHVNLAICMSSKRPVSISLPLENCNYGTTLQVTSAAREAQSGTDEISCEGSSSTSTERAQMNKAVIIVEIYFEPAIKEVLSIASRFQGVMSIHMEIKDEKLVLTVIGDFDVISMGAELSLLWVTELVSFGPA